MQSSRPSRPEGTVAGLSCCQVLARLSDFLDGELGVRERRQVEAHLAACDLCRQTGGEVEALVEGCHHLLDRTPPLDPALHRRLLARLAAES